MFLTLETATYKKYDVVQTGNFICIYSKSSTKVDVTDVPEAEHVRCKGNLSN
jgi:hypothetical protein